MVQSCCFDKSLNKVYNREVKSVLIISILYSSLALSSQWMNENWSGKSNDISFKFNEDLSLRISVNCFQNYNKCEALRATRYAEITETKSIEGESPYSRVCAKSTKGKVVFLKNKQGHSSSFCLFKDGSLIDNASLYVKVKNR